MSIKRGPDGFPVEVPTTITKKTDGDTAGNNQTKIVVNLDDQPDSEAPTVFTESSSNDGGSLFLDEPTTVLAGASSSKAAAEVSEPADEPKTTIARGKPSSDQSASSQGDVAAAGVSKQSDAMADPVAGWLVVIAGAGQGNFMKLGYGQNSIGRGTSERVCVDFGDSQISRANHAVVTYDPRGRQFYIQPGSGTNLVYIDENEVPVLQPMVLNPLSHIHLGDTTLRFIPFCTKDFCWETLEDK